MRESQETIVQWQLTSFGKLPSMERGLARANEELAELLKAITGDDTPEKICVEAADVVIVLCGEFELCKTKFRFDLLQAHPPRDTPYRDAVEALKAMARAMSIVQNTGGSPRFALAEIVDRMHAVCCAYDRDLRDEIDAKMAINHARRWDVSEDGCAYHKRETGEDIVTEAINVAAFRQSQPMPCA